MSNSERYFDRKNTKENMRIPGFRRARHGQLECLGRFYVMVDYVGMKPGKKNCKTPRTKLMPVDKMKRLIDAAQGNLKKPLNYKINTSYS